MSEPVVINLKKPITFGSRTVEQLTIRPVKAKDLRRISKGESPMQLSLNMAGWLSGEIKEVIDELEGEDLAEVLKVVDGFFTKLQPTGQTS
jgi:Phage tail assembly chaperone proteins, E, or 41 or 14